MAAVTGVNVTQTFVASGDLSAQQYNFCKIIAANKVALNTTSGGAAGIVIGVMGLSGVTNGQHMTVVKTGRFKVRAGAALATINTPITSNVSGRAIAVASGSTVYCQGWTREVADADGDVIEVELVNPYNWSGDAV